MKWCNAQRACEPNYRPVFAACNANSQQYTPAADAVRATPRLTLILTKNQHWRMSAIS